MRRRGQRGEWREDRGEKDRDERKEEGGERREGERIIEGERRKDIRERRKHKIILRGGERMEK